MHMEKKYRELCNRKRGVFLYLLIMSGSLWQRGGNSILSFHPIFGIDLKFVFSFFSRLFVLYESHRHYFSIFFFVTDLGSNFIS